MPKPAVIRFGWLLLLSIGALGCSPGGQGSDETAPAPVDTPHQPRSTRWQLRIPRWQRRRLILRNRLLRRILHPAAHSRPARLVRPAKARE